MARPAPADEGSPGRVIAAMVGIVGILLLGSLAWSAVGALFSTVGEAAHAFSSGTPAPKLGLGGGPGTPSTPPTARGTATQAPRTATQVDSTPTSSAVVTATPSPVSTPTPEASITVTPTASAGGRSPWVLLPGPAPGAHVQPGPQLIEARGRGDSAITAIRLELDGAALDVSLEQRSDSVWRGSAAAQVAPGHHTARATVVDDQGRSGSFRWTFDAGP